jgi:hypothetical protein
MEKQKESFQVSHTVPAYAELKTEFSRGGGGISDDFKRGQKSWRLHRSCQNVPIAPGTRLWSRSCTRSLPSTRSCGDYAS